MTEDTRTGAAGQKPTREERLAAKLRENLRRRKVQAREMAAAPEPCAIDDSGRLPKPPPES